MLNFGASRLCFHFSVDAEDLRTGKGIGEKEEKRNSRFRAHRLLSPKEGPRAGFVARKLLLRGWRRGPRGLVLSVIIGILGFVDPRGGFHDMFSFHPSCAFKPIKIKVTNQLFPTMLMPFASAIR